MAVCRTHIDAPPEAVFDVLTDAASYRIWVVGSKRIRGVDPDWPQVGSSFHHTVGWGPIEDDDTTEIVELDRPRRLVLKARVWPLGSAEVKLDLRPAHGGTEVTITEEPIAGPAAKLNGWLEEAAIKARNWLSLRRLKAWSEQRYHARPGVRPEP
jgi:uncharacterized protein YndB with AHSA1/START domain